MKSFWQRFWAALTPGVRILLGLLAAVYLAAVIGKWIHAFDLYDWLAVSGPKFRGGQIWRLVTYALLPLGRLDFLFNGLALILLGGQLERHWSRGELWLYCGVTAAGAGLAKVLLQFSSPMPLVGTTPMMFGLLIGWGFLCGRETLCIAPFGKMTVLQLVLVAGAISFLMLFLTAGPVLAIIMATGGLTGWLYLWLRHKWLMSRTSRVAHSERINRLEL
jgi:membrane associated rhomboid family serine protease